MIWRVVCQPGRVIFPLAVVGVTVGVGVGWVGGGPVLCATRVSLIFADPGGRRTMCSSWGAAV
jgi:hypothetical protein